MEEAISSLLPYCSKTSVSSVLNKDVKQFGRQHMFDNDEETCWNSHQGSPQWVFLAFDRDVLIQKIQIQFQGGFAGKTCRLSDRSVLVHDFYPDDSNTLQIFSLPSAKLMKNMKLEFVDSTDLYGRITVYKLDVLGRQGQ
eukprot:m.311392 g.311392  ORF g.311392 m.311392 type:complete len:140 (+) comp67834_c0_seq1:21-440(+)